LFIIYHLLYRRLLSLLRLATGRELSIIVHQPSLVSSTAACHAAILVAGAIAAVAVAVALGSFVSLFIATGWFAAWMKDVPHRLHRFQQETSSDYRYALGRTEATK
jgi:pheromone shutdown protein TraB